jgi:hypothetical protein
MRFIFSHTLRNIASHVFSQTALGKQGSLSEKSHFHPLVI